MNKHAITINAHGLATIMVWVLASVIAFALQALFWVGLWWLLDGGR